MVNLPQLLKKLEVSANVSRPGYGFVVVGCSCCAWNMVYIFAVLACLNWEPKMFFWSLFSFYFSPKTLDIYLELINSWVIMLKFS